MTIHYVVGMNCPSRLISCPTVRYYNFWTWTWLQYNWLYLYNVRFVCDASIQETGNWGWAGNVHRNCLWRGTFHPDDSSTSVPLPQSSEDPSTSCTVTKVPAALLGPTVMQQQQLNDLTINGNLTKGSTKYLVYSLKHEELINLDQMQWIIYMAPSCLRRRSMAAKDVRNHQVNCLKEGAYRLRM